MAGDILVIDNYDSFTRNLTALIAESGRGFTVVRNDEIPENVAQRYDYILISPGPGTPSGAGDVCAFIRKYAPVKSILGVCLGHQAIAEVFGGELFRLPRPDHGVGRTVRITDPGCRIFRGMPETFEAGFYHSWAVARDTFPAALKPTAVSSDHDILAFSHREFDVHGVQFHPESVMTPAGRTIIANWLDE